MKVIIKFRDGTTRTIENVSWYEQPAAGNDFMVSHSGQVDFFTVKNEIKSVEVKYKD